MITNMVHKATCSDSYEDDFFASRHERTVLSSQAIIAELLPLLAPNTVDRVVDIGCGVGTFLRTFQQAGATAVLGVDGPWVQRDMLQIEIEEFLVADLAKPLVIPQMFDLALSLEVAEHLPEEAAGTFVASLVRLAPVILFSAAIPGQGGTNHVNEQWPSHWVARFEEHGFVPVDCIRSRIWNCPDVLLWYKQNCMIFAKQSSLENYPQLMVEHERSGLQCLPLVHPDLLLDRTESADFLKALTLGRWLRLAPGLFAKSFSTRWMKGMKKLGLTRCVN